MVEVLTSEDVWSMDVTELAERLSEGPVVYHATDEERAALAWLGDRYEISRVLNDACDGARIHVDPVAVGEALWADGLDDIPCMTDTAGLQRAVWAIGPSEPPGPIKPYPGTGWDGRLSINDCDTRETKAPAYGRNASGYGTKVPTRWMVRVHGDSRWRRVYVTIYSNVGTTWIQWKGGRVVVDA